MVWGKKNCLHVFLIAFLFFLFILLISTLSAVFLFWDDENLNYCVPLISDCSHLNDAKFNETKLNETDKYDETKEEETPYSIWEQCLKPELNPCDDFNRFACGNYKSKQKILGMEEHYYYVVQFDDLVNEQIRECFLDTLNSDKSNSSSAIQKMRRYQKEYERTGGINEEVSILQLIDEIRSFGSCPALSSEKDWKDNDITDMLLKMTNLTGLPYLYEINWEDVFEGQIHPAINPSRLIFSNPSATLKKYAFYYVDRSRWGKENNMRIFFEQIFGLIKAKMNEIDKGPVDKVDEGSGSDEHHDIFIDPDKETIWDISERMKEFDITQNLVKLELQLIHIYDKWNYFEPDNKTAYEINYLNQSQYYERFGIVDIEKYLFNSSRIPTFLKDNFYYNNYHIKNNSLYFQNKFTDELSRVYRTSNNGVLKDYLCLRFVLDRMPYLGKEFRDLASEFEEYFEGEVHEILPTYNDDTKDHVESNFPLLADHLFVTHCKSSQKQLVKAREIVNKVLDAAMTWIEKADWLDPVSQENVIKKLNSTLIAIGASEIAFNQTKLDEMYEKLDFKETDGIMEMERKLGLFNSWHSLSVLHAYDNYVDFKVLEKRATVINAYAGKVYPFIFFALGYLFPPNFDVSQPYSNGYATVGANAGHELFHLLDASGVNYIFDGTRQSIFDDSETKADFEDKTLCLQKQYTRQKDSSGLNLKGSKTLHEDIPDNVGLQVSYHAYLEHLKKEGGDEKIAGYSNYTHEQSFFINFAVRYCSEISLKTRKWQILNNDHTLSEYRVNMPLKNFPAFSRAFNCSIGTPMNPRKKCRVWKKK